MAGDAGSSWSWRGAGLCRLWRPGHIEVAAVTLLLMVAPTSAKVGTSARVSAKEALRLDPMELVQEAVQVSARVNFASTSAPGSAEPSAWPIKAKHQARRSPGGTRPSLQQRSASRREWVMSFHSALRHIFPDTVSGAVVSVEVPPDDIPSGAAIWDKNSTWVPITRWHPAGLVSNMYHGHIYWTDASYMSLNALLILSCVCYPAFLLAIIMALTLLISVCLGVKPEGDLLEEAKRQTRNGENKSVMPATPLLRRDHLTNLSQKLYNCWVWFCATIPCQFVFGLPTLLMFLSRPYPQEVFTMLSLVTSMLMFSNGIYMVIFAGGSIFRMARAMQTSYGKMLPEHDARYGEFERVDEIFHWVFVPQYKEAIENVSMAMGSIAKSSIAKTNIGVVLAMEARELEAEEKAKELRRRYAGQFKEIIETYHPPDLPNHPPGKASNMAWSFERLVEHVTKNHQDPSKIIMTVADADSEFHQEYFEGLTFLVLEAGEQRNLRIWQSPVLHVKNYHRQPMPVIVGTMFTCMQELATLSDPHAIRFPYSTYSLSMELAKGVGGWDPDWIAEDWHMGIKCFLLTLGQSSVEPLLLPTTNYTPEDMDWWGTVCARWSQAKRHALGFSDLAYYFMVLPLVFGHAANQDLNQELSKNANKETCNKEASKSMRQVWLMLFSGVSLVVKLTNVHVIIGVLTSYGVLCCVLKLLMLALLGEDRHVGFLVDRMHFSACIFTSTSLGCMVTVTLLFNAIYCLLRGRMEGEPYRWIVLHWLYTLIACMIWGPFYFFGLGICIWKAAISMLTQKSFHYEVAMKPTTSQRLG